ncbi:hypothetical protein JY412_04110 [Stenotrophomonas maltophilia]|nr:hypothetical protein [Stenotrophomonas maltophilia]
MLTFKTQFPLRSDVEMADFMECCRAWISGSPHTLLNGLKGGRPEGVHEVDGERAEFLAATGGGFQLGGVRYEKADDEGVHWTTEVVGCKSLSGEFFVSVQLSVDAEVPVEKLDKGRRPYILKLLMQRFSGGKDGGLVVDDMPLFLSEDQQDLAADIICARAGSAMPVVYVSRQGDGSLSVDPNRLAEWISAMAHVVVEPSRSFSIALSREVFGENPYGGAVAIYWPDGIGRWLYLPDRWKGSGELQAAIARKVRSSLLYHRIRQECTWSHLQQCAANERFEELRKSGAGSLEEYMAHFDGEIAEQRKTIAEQGEEIRRLQARLNLGKFSGWATESVAGDTASTVELASSERDLYQGEQLSAVLDALQHAANSAEANSRRRHILTSIIKSNRNEGEREIITAKLKDILSQYESMSPAVRRELEALGFEVDQEGKHCKITFRGEERFPFILSKTASDHRTGKNAFAQIKKKLF